MNQSLSSGQGCSPKATCEFNFSVNLQAPDPIARAVILPVRDGVG